MNINGILSDVMKKFILKLVHLPEGEYIIHLKVKKRDAGHNLVCWRFGEYTGDLEGDLFNTN